jgi:ubiquinone/menaquinone biosynthesis C-methylase UbiE
VHKYLFRNAEIASRHQVKQRPGQRKNYLGLAFSFRPEILPEPGPCDGIGTGRRGKDMTLKTSEKYSRIAQRYDLYEYPIELLLFQKLRAEAISHAQGKTLEVGIGTGKNLPYYGTDIELTAVDFSLAMLKIAQKKQKNMPDKNLHLQAMDVQALGFANNSFDTIISTFVFCTVPEPIAGLKELHRVLKPSGKAIFLEHMKSNHGLLNVFLYMMNFFSTRLLGTSMVRETEKNIRLAKFTVQSVEHKVFDVVRLIIAIKA